MKLELRENMYVRNCYGRIAKIEYIEDNTAYCDDWLYQSYEDHITFINLDDEDDIDEILKASYNITDILEIGDYVNNERVEEIWKEIVLVGQECRPISFNNIKSIVTKEQFENIKYEI